MNITQRKHAVERIRQEAGKKELEIRLLDRDLHQKWVDAISIHASEILAMLANGKKLRKTPKAHGIATNIETYIDLEPTRKFKRTAALKKGLEEPLKSGGKYISGIFPNGLSSGNVSVNSNIYLTSTSERLEALKKRVQEASDGVMLGDAEEARSAIKTMSNYDI